MKKLISLFLLIAMLATSALGLLSCSTEHPIDKFARELIASGNNYTITLKGEALPVIDKLDLSVSVNGNVRYILQTLLTPEAYLETGDEYDTLYTKDPAGEWQETKKEKKKDKTDLTFDVANLLSLLDLTESMMILSFLNAQNYEELKGEKKTYKLKDVASIPGIGDLKELKLKLDKKSCTLTLKVKLDGEGVSTIRLTIDSVGEVAPLTPPEKPTPPAHGNKK